MTFLSRFSSTKRLSKRAPPAPPARGHLPALSLDLPDLPSPSFAGRETPSTASLASDGERWERVPEPVVEGQEQLRAREEREKRKLGRARLGVASASVLVELCAKVIRERGSTTLGIFRPYRLAEDPREMRKLALLFLAYADAATVPGAKGREAHDPVVRDLFGAGVSSKQGNLEMFQEELKWANVHDVVGLLKWGLRHLRYSTSFSGSTLGPLTWYTTFRTLATPPDAFTTVLIPTLPASSQTLLISTLSLLESIAAQAEANAMGARRLSLLLGAYVFGVLDTDASWGDLYQRWLDAGEAMEGTLKAYLCAQGVEGLPRRLREVVGSWPKDAPSEARKVKVLKVEMITQGDWRETGVNSQATGLEGADSRAKRRPPLVILAGALEADYDELAINDDARGAWTALVRLGKGRPLEVLSDETNRVLGLVGLADLPEPPIMSPLSTTSSTFTSRRRSFSHDPTLLSPLSEDGSFSTSPYGAARRFPNKSVGNLLPPRPTSSWSEFAATGFGDDQSELGLLPPRPLKAATVGPAAARLNKGLPRSPSEGSVPSVRPSEPQPKQPTSTITNISVVELDDEFQDYYLDTLVDPACDGWPSFVLSDLSPRAIADGVAVDHILVSESLVPFEGPADEQPPMLNRALSSRSTASLADSTMSQRWNRRMSSLFTGSLASKARYANGGSFASNDPISPVIPPAPSSPRKKKSSPPPVPSSPAANGSPLEGPKKARRFSLSKRTSRTSLPGENGVPALPTMPLNFQETPLSSPAEAVEAVETVEPKVVAPPSPPAPTLPDKDVPAKDALVELPTPISRPPTPAKSALRPQSVRKSIDKVQPQHASSDLVDLPPVSVDESDMHQGHAPTVSDMFAPPEETDDMEYHAVDIESPRIPVDEPTIAQVEQACVVEPESVVDDETLESAREPTVESVVERTTVPVQEAVIEAPAHAPLVDAPVEPVPEPLVKASPAIEAPVVSKAAPAPVLEPTPTFELSPPVQEPEPQVEHLVPAPVRKDSVETLRRSPEEVEVLEAQQAGVAAAEPVSHAQEVSEDSTLIASPTSVRSPSIPHSPTLGSPLATASSRTSDSSTVAAGRSPSTKSAKRFLGSAAIGGLLRRKKSTTSEPKVEKLTKAELKEAKKREAIEKKKEVPVPVSSVKKRVAELEAAAREKDAASGSESGKASPVPVQESAPSTPATKVVLPLLSTSSASPATDSTASDTPIEHQRAAFGSPSPTDDDAPSTPTAQSHFDLPDSPPSPSPPSPTLVYHAKEWTPEHNSEAQEELHSGASTPSSSEQHHDANANGSGPVLHSIASSTSLAETTTSFQTADSEQSL